MVLNYRYRTTGLQDYEDYQITDYREYWITVKIFKYQLLTATFCNI